MTNVISAVKELFEQLLKNPKNFDSFAAKLKYILNEELGDEKRNFKPVTCNNVFISTRNSDEPFYSLVIPVMPTSGDTVLSTDHIRTYDVDIDMNNFITSYNKYGLDVNEATAWFVHELYSNIVTDATFNRYKKLLIKYYDDKNGYITSSHNNLGYMTWFTVFGNTAKEMVNEFSDDIVSQNLKLLGLDEYWNTALDKYVITRGGDYSILTGEYLSNLDKSALEIFNKLSRKYSSYTIKYANTDWKTLVNYMCANIGSECLKNYVSKEPEHIAAVPEKKIFEIFDSQRLLKEDADQYTEIEDSGEGVADRIKSSGYFAEYSVLELDVQNVTTMSEKLYAAAKLKDFLSFVDAELAKDEFNQDLQYIREKVYLLSQKLNDTYVAESNELEIN